MIRRPPRSTQSRSSAASDVYKRQTQSTWGIILQMNFGKVSRLLLAYADDPDGKLLMIKHYNPTLKIPFQEFITPDLNFTKVIPNGLLYVCLLYTSPSPRDS
eukprot:TRINITY_DN17451_c0_g1_i3.p1 TRINITY_DN17451_c0_g1~~TRINITY_DN17451_c0_g1_i3.p1  ORF type:complete len:102 (-),score=21.24 TRINITY_DN17451_c0_g1_i3:38-343(-)